MYLNQQYPHRLKSFTIAVTVYNKPGVMARITSLITRRGFNIESISAGDTKENDLYRITIVIKGDDRAIEQIQKQIYKMIDTVKVTQVNEENKIAKEMAFIKIKALNGDKVSFFQLIDVYKGSIVDTTQEGFVVQMVGSHEKVNRFIGLFPPNKIMEIARTGIVAMNRWE